MLTFTVYIIKIQFQQLLLQYPRARGICKDTRRILVSHKIHHHLHLKRNQTTHRQPRSNTCNTQFQKDLAT